jgi:integrase/recombinase XerD
MDRAPQELKRLCAFFRFAHDRQWVESNPARRIKLPKVSIRPTMPLTAEEIVKILAACEASRLKAEKAIAKLNAYRLKTLVLLMCYSGMRISDAVTLSFDRLDGKKLFLYTQKTGVPVYTVLPDSVPKALEATPRTTEKNYFWSGDCHHESIAGLWEKRLKKLFGTAGVSKGPQGSPKSGQ